MFDRSNSRFDNEYPASRVPDVSRSRSCKRACTTTLARNAANGSELQARVIVGPIASQFEFTVGRPNRGWHAIENRVGGRINVQTLITSPRDRAVKRIPGRRHRARAFARHLRYPRNPSADLTVRQKEVQSRDAMTSALKQASAHIDFPCVLVVRSLWSCGRSFGAFESRHRFKNRFLNYINTDLKLINSSARFESCLVAGDPTRGETLYFFLTISRPSSFSSSTREL